MSKIKGIDKSGPNIFFYILDDEMLLSYLRSCNFSLEKTKVKLDKYFTIKNVLPEVFANFDITRPELQECMHTV